MRKISALLALSALGLASFRLARLASAGGGYISATGVATPVTVANGGTGTSTAFTAGSVIFAGTGGTYNQNNANFFWDNTNIRLGIGATPGASLDVSGTGAVIRVRSGGDANGLQLSDGGPSSYKQLQSFEGTNLALNPAGNNVTVRLAGTSALYPFDVSGDTYLRNQLIVAGTSTVSGNAFSVGGSTFVITGSSVGIRTSSPLYALQNAGDSYTQGEQIVGGTMTVVGNAFSVGGSTFQVANGSVSINGLAFIGGVGSGGALGPVGTAVLTVQSTTTTGGYGIADFRNNSGNTVLYVAQNGKLGLATSAPGDLISNTGATITDQIGTSNTNGSGITLSPSAAGFGMIINNQSAAGTANGILARTTGVASTNKVLSLNANGTDVGVMTGAGFFGVGTSTPSTKMHMSSGTFTIDGNVSPAIDVLNGLTGLWSRTKAQIDLITPTRAGQMLYCSDCATANTCVSTGTTLSGFRRSDSTTAGCGSGN